MLLHSSLKTLPDVGKILGDEITEADFIPYACHFDEHTLLTKNGELMQIIEITGNKLGLDYEADDITGVTLRDLLREALCSGIPSDHFAVWIHTERSKKPFTVPQAAGHPVAAAIHKEWQALHPHAHVFQNRVYVCILKQGQSADLFDFKDWKKGLRPLKNRRFRGAYMESSLQEVSAAVEAVVALLSTHFMARRLGVAAGEKGVATSEPLGWLNRLINLDDAAIPVVEGDASVFLARNDMTFGFNALECRGKNKHKAFAAILTLKTARDLPSVVIDRFLQLPEAMIITEAFTFEPRKAAIDEVLEIQGALEACPDELVRGISGINQLLKHDTGKPTDFGRHQVSVMIIREQYKALDASVGNVQRAFAEVGLVPVREDIKLEEVFWSQLPGNFTYLRRKQPLALAQAGGFCRLNHFPTGTPAGGRWGRAVTVLPTTSGTPYFFHFHQGENGHTLMLDYNSFPDHFASAALHFLLSESMHLAPRIVLFDYDESSRLWAQAMGGAFGTLYRPATIRTEAGPGSIRMNPFVMEDTARNRGFLQAWLAMCCQSPASPPTDALKQACMSAVAEVMSLPLAERHLAAAYKAVRSQGETLVDASREQLLLPVFSKADDTVDMQAAVTAMDMTALKDVPQLRLVTFAYLFHRLILSLSGKPTIIVLRDAWSLLDNPFFAPRLTSLFTMLTEQNAMVFSTIRNIDDRTESPITADMIKLAATTMVLPDDIPNSYLADEVGLSAREVGVLKKLERRNGELLLKHGNEVLSVRIDALNLPEFSSILAGDGKAMGQEK